MMLSLPLPQARALAAPSSSFTGRHAKAASSSRAVMPRRQKCVPTTKAFAGLASVSLRRSRSAARQQRSCTLVVSAAAEPGESNPEITAASSSSSSSYTVPGEVSFPGMYCDWSVTGEDKVEVWSYRACLSAVAVSCLVCSSVWRDGVQLYTRETPLITRVFL
jgi:hypothetical protein